MRGNPAELPIWFVAFLFSITCHEAAHALAAKLGGDDTAEEQGQVSLNPLPHIRQEPIGTILIPLVSYVMSGWMLGWASAPYDPHWQARYPHRAAWMALAGPAANIIVAIISGAAIYAGLHFGYFEYPSHVSFTSIVQGTNAQSPNGFAVFLSVLFCLNLLLAVFNLIPLPPLDGIKVIGLLMSEDLALKVYEFSREPAFQMIGILLSWQLIDYVFPPVFLAALKMIY